MPRPEKTSAEARFWALWAAAGALELPWLLYLLAGRDPLGPASLLLAHAAAACLVWLACPARREAGIPTRPWAQTLALAALALPGWGWLLAALVRPARAAPAAAPAEALADELLDEEDDEEPSESWAGLEEGRRLHEAADIAPAADILLGRDASMKRGAVETLARIRTPGAIAWLLKSRSDADPEVRFYATSALTNLRRDFEHKRRAAESALFKRPGDAELSLSLKRLTLEYAVSGLVDQRSKEALLAEARSGLEALSQRKPEALPLLFELEREAHPEAALTLLDRLIARDGRDALPWIREKTRLLFRLGRHAEVSALMRDNAAEILATPAGPLEAPEAAQWKSAALWWTNA